MRAETKNRSETVVQILLEDELEIFAMKQVGLLTIRDIKEREIEEIERRSNRDGQDARLVKRKMDSIFDAIHESLKNLNEEK